MASGARLLSRFSSHLGQKGIKHEYASFSLCGIRLREKNKLCKYLKILSAFSILKKENDKSAQSKQALLNREAIIHNDLA